MYTGTFVEIYDAIYTRMKNYEQEAAKVREWITQAHPSAKTLLDVACGTAEHAKYLKTSFKIDGLDINEDFLRVARRKNPECAYFTGDMSEFALGKQYDVVMSLFSSIGYVLTPERLQKTVARFASHLAPGGVILVEPWLTPESWLPGIPRMYTIDEPALKVCRMSHAETRNGHSFMEFSFLVGTPEEVRHFTEEHLLGLFSVGQMKAAFEANGLKVSFDENGLFGRGLFIAQKA